MLPGEDVTVHPEHMPQLVVAARRFIEASGRGATIVGGAVRGNVRITTALGAAPGNRDGIVAASAAGGAGNAGDRIKQGTSRIVANQAETAVQRVGPLPDIMSGQLRRITQSVVRTFSNRPVISPSSRKMACLIAKGDCWPLSL